MGGAAWRWLLTDGVAIMHAITAPAPQPASRLGIQIRGQIKRNIAVISQIAGTEWWGEERYVTAIITWGHEDVPIKLFTYQRCM